MLRRPIPYALLLGALLGCQTNTPSPEASAPDPAPTQTTGAPTAPAPPSASPRPAVRFGPVAVTLPEGWSHELRDSELTAKSTDAETRCGAHTLSVRLVQHARDLNDTSLTGSRCQIQRNVRTLLVPEELDTNGAHAVVVCEVRGEFDGLGVPDACEDVFAGVTIADDVAPPPDAKTTEVLTREKLHEDLSNEYGSHEVFIPGAAHWRFLSPAGRRDLNGDGVDAHFFQDDVVPDGANTIVFMKGASGAWVEHELDYVAGAIHAPPAPKTPGAPVDLFLELSDMGETTCARYTWGGETYRASEKRCPKKPRRGAAIE
jgi:hypothetical protein